LLLPAVATGTASCVIATAVTEIAIVVDIKIALGAAAAAVRLNSRHEPGGVGERDLRSLSPLLLMLRMMLLMLMLLLRLRLCPPVPQLLRLLLRPLLLLPHYIIIFHPQREDGVAISLWARFLVST